MTPHQPQSSRRLAQRSWLYLAVCLTSYAIWPAQTVAEWPQSSGPSRNYAVGENAPTHWSVALGKNVRWATTLPETGQSTPVISRGRVFLTTMAPVQADSELGTDIVAWSLDAATGEVVWKRTIQSKYESRLSGNFGDSSAPAAVSDGELVAFFSASGAVECFDFQGNRVWRREFLTVNRTQPFLHRGKIVLTRQIYEPSKGRFSHAHRDAPKSQWTQLHCLDLATGKDGWTSECGVNMGCHIMPQQLNDGRWVAAVGRGGGHGPPEKPEGVSLIDLSDGATLWTLPLTGFMATQSYPIRNDVLSIFHKGEHLAVNALKGEIKQRVSIVNDVTLHRRHGDAWETVQRTIPATKSRMITQGSNLQVGEWHYFRSYTQPWLGRVHVASGKLEYLELPLQLDRRQGKVDSLLWFKPVRTQPPKTTESQASKAVEKRPSRKRKAPSLKDQGIPNLMKNSRGFVVMGDKRSRGNGWGHTASPPPTAAGRRLYIPVQNGTVYVIQWDAAKLDGEALVAVNDLGLAGQSFTRASLSFSDGRIFAHTIKEVICIGD